MPRSALAFALLVHLSACEDEPEPAARAEATTPAPEAPQPKCPETKVSLSKRLGGQVEKVVEACRDPLGRDAAIDAKVSGSWKGEYGYDDSSPSVEVETTLTVSGGALTGSTSEPDTSGYYGRLAANLVGDVYATRQVVFMKTYATGTQSRSVLYIGRLREDGKRIDGNWRVETLTGTFWLERQ